MYCNKLKAIIKDVESIKNNINAHFVKEFHKCLEEKTSIKERQKLNPIKFANEMNVSEEQIMKFFVIGKRVGLFKARAFYSCSCGEYFEIFSFEGKVECENECEIDIEYNKEKVFIYFELLEEIQADDFGDDTTYQMDYISSSDLGPFHGTLNEYEALVGEEEASNLLNKEIENSTEEIMHLAVIVALDDELEPVKSLLSDCDEIYDDEDESTIYYKGRFKKDGKSINVVAAQSIQMGMTAAATLSMKLIYKFQPKYLAMTGIAAGVKNSERNFGDILVADQTYDYGSGKMLKEDETEKFIPAPQPIPILPGLKAKFQRFKKDYPIMGDIKHKFQGKKPSSELTIHIGPVGSGAAVVANNTLISRIRENNGKLIGIEMETYAVYFAATHCIGTPPKVFSMKSIVDFADQFKGDEYREYACYTSAKCLYEFCFSYLYDDMTSDDTLEKSKKKGF
ncbi:hypothetical protein [Clostridium thailandense]|uniref:5'-methylthioadenosine/S-adenosylhomocysteine nucleosidase family protein n=1 Tax=Clostridium thailandense TaxID=2794346 RepID=UPI003989C7BE